MDERQIIFQDNHVSRELLASEAEKLCRYAGCGLKKLCADNPGLLLFPDCLGEHGDDIEEPLYSIVANKLWTGNIVGFWGVDGVNVRVHSRFDSDERQYFFHYMLQRIAGVNVLDFATLPDLESVWDFLIYLFPMALKRATRQGLYRTYRFFRHDDVRVRGTIEVARFIRYDIPFSGRVAYTTREYTADNHLIHLVRHVIEFIRRRAPVLLSMDLEVRQAVDLIIRITPDYAEHARNRVVAANLRPVQHPYYSAYTGLQKLCLQILRHEKLSYGASDGSISGVVFDAAWLWEEYLNSVFVSDPKWKGVVHPQNKLGLNPIFFYKPDSEHKSYRSKHYPDFYCRTHSIVLDAKYKPDTCVEREDLLQMVAYLHVLEYRTGVFVKPNQTDTNYRNDGTLATAEGETIGVLKLMIPSVGQKRCYQDFVELIYAEERKLLSCRMCKEMEGGNLNSPPSVHSA